MLSMPSKCLRYGLIVGLTLAFLLTVTPVFGMVAQYGQEDNLDAIARATTVFIGPDLEKESFANSDISEYSGSGVIIAKQLVAEGIFVGFPSGTVSGNIRQYNYYVLTNAHVVADETVYGVRVNDGEIYRIDDSFEYKEQFQDSPIAFNIHRFGAAIDDQGNYNGADLAIAKFVSNKSYPVATISRVGEVTDSDQVLISGWPLPDVAERSTRSRFSRYGQLVARDESRVSAPQTLLTGRF
jgi:Trypsin-like peptidase domain